MNIVKEIDVKGFLDDKYDALDGYANYLDDATFMQ